MCKINLSKLIEGLRLEENMFEFYIIFYNLYNLSKIIISKIIFFYYFFNKINLKKLIKKKLIN